MPRSPRAATETRITTDLSPGLLTQIPLAQLTRVRPLPVRLAPRFPVPLAQLTRIRPLRLRLWARLRVRLTAPPRVLQAGLLQVLTIRAAPKHPLAVGKAEGIKAAATGPLHL